MRASLSQPATSRDGSATTSEGALQAKKTSAAAKRRSKLARADLDSAKDVRLRPVLAARLVKTLENTGARPCRASVLWVNNMRTCRQFMPPLSHDSTWAITNRTRASYDRLSLRYCWLTGSERVPVTTTIAIR